MCTDGKPPIAPLPKNWNRSAGEWDAEPAARKPQEIPELYSSRLRSLLRNLLKKDPQDRFDALQLFQAVIEYYDEKGPAGESEFLEHFAFDYLNAYRR